jgi:hypothetical protein
LQNKRKKKQQRIRTTGKAGGERNVEEKRHHATKEVGGEVVIEVNREEWICTLCEEIAAEDMVCCQHSEK